MFVGAHESLFLWCSSCRLHEGARERDGKGERSRVTFQMCFYGPVKGGVGVRGWGGVESEPIRE